MAMDKRFLEIFERLEAIEAALRDLQAPQAHTVTLEELTAIKGVGESTAKEILKLLNR